MSPALQTSPSKSSSVFSLGRFLWIVVAALALSMVLYWAFRLPDRTPESEEEVAPVSAAAPEPAGETMIGVQPPSFQQISEFREGSRFRLRLVGTAEPGAVIILTDKGERLRQVRVNDQGQWGVTLDAAAEPMVLDAQLFTGETLPSIQSEETIFRLPSPTGEETDAENYTNSSLIMVMAPGRPSRIIQSPFGEVPTAGPLSLSVIDYDHSGGVIITGSSSIPGRIRIYAQDAVIGETGIGVSGRWNYIAGRILPAGEVEIRAELIAAQGIPDAPDSPIFISVPFSLLPPLQANAADENGSLSVNFQPGQWQIRRTLIGGGGQSTVIFAPQAAE